MTRIVLVRHGQTDWNYTRRIQGSSDVPLNDVGRRQAGDAADALSDRSWDRILTSPLSRAVETAEILAARLGLGAPEAVSGLVERSYGLAEGLTSDEVHERFPGGAVPGRESVEVLTTRALAAIAALAARFEVESVIVVTHGGVIGALVRSVSNNKLPGERDRIVNGSAHTFDYKGGALSLVEFAGAAEDLDLVDERVVE